jgi:hypothetical protein
MTELTVIEALRDGDGLSASILAGIGRYGGAEGVRLTTAASCSELRGSRPDILVLSEEAPMSCLRPESSIRCGILLLPGDTVADDTVADDRIAGGNDTCGCEAGCIVTYGMSPKNTITLSSISETSCVLAIQREFLTVSGDMLERQEIRIMGGMKPGRLLAVAGALLILGLKITDSNP